MRTVKAAGKKKNISNQDMSSLSCFFCFGSTKRTRTTSGSIVPEACRTKAQNTLSPPRNPKIQRPPCR
ncbi:hypothetical protein HMPREF3293_02557 [Christensenella minuta]|uniref:Uncharacterized protein n=1 Tax=Christensenella minuta TaxID=626937 RepID=A0A136Q1A2_9FIRM|nr:hypothetical protein HMPREF3293_02557 [Christensenella minuta]